MTPTATYRVQIRPDFDFDATAELADYLAALGVSHLYAAPMLQASPGSAHGYDVVDHGRANAEWGGEDGRRRLVAALRARGLGLVVDIVPNHMGVAVPHANAAWWDVLTYGPESRYARWFDVDWTGSRSGSRVADGVPARGAGAPTAGGDTALGAATPERGRLVLPILDDRGDPLADLSIVDGELRYKEHRFPIAPGTGYGEPRAVHDRQHYELVSWRRDDELNYRRFFAVKELAGLRVEDPAVRDASHAEILRWYAAGEVDGIRVDHPDGLRDPAGYLAWLRDAAPDAWLVVEKILADGERLPPWPVAGTTGYDALHEVGGLFLDPAGEAALCDPAAYDVAVHEGKLDVATGMLRAELNRLVRLASGAPAAGEALAEIAACFPVYRSYLPDGLDHLAGAAVAAVRRRPDLASTVDALLPRLSDVHDELALRFQQFTGAVMAKGVEDTAFYRYPPLLAGNEVGGSPTRTARGTASFHAACRRRQAAHPTGMTALSTHDTKRSEDVRARLAVLAEIAGDWRAALYRWTAAAPLPDAAVASLLWQTFVAAWPIEADRMHAVMEKSAREARTATSWNDPDAGFERAMHAVIDRVYAEPALRKEIGDFADRITPPGRSNSLGQKLVQLTMPGVPDGYQGCELWDNSLVDPDNRRPVDFAVRRDLLARLDTGWLPAVDATGAAKLLVVSRALRLRRDRPELFSGYAQAAVRGLAADHAVAFDRGGALTVATRLPVTLAERGGWSGTTLVPPPGRWVDALTGREVRGEIPLAALLDTYPVALLARMAG